MAVTAIALTRYLLHLQRWIEVSVEDSGFEMDELQEPYVAVSQLLNSEHLKSIQNKYGNIFQRFYCNIE